MSYWFREAAGWIVLVIGLVVFGLVYDLLLKKRILEAGSLAFVGFVVFRGGVHLLKVAMAARAAQTLPSPQAGPPRRTWPSAVNAPRVQATDARRGMPGPSAPGRS